MKNNPIDLLSARIDHLEKSNKRLIILLSGILGLALLTFAKAQPTDSLEVKRLALVDTKGVVRAELVLREGRPGLFLKDEAGKDRLQLIHDQDQSALFIKDEKGTVRIGVAQFSHGGGGVALHGPDSKGAAVLYFKKNGSLRFFDGDGVVTDQMPSPKSN